MVWDKKLVLGWSFRPIIQSTSRRLLLHTRPPEPPFLCLTKLVLGWSFRPIIGGSIPPLPMYFSLFLTTYKTTITSFAWKKNYSSESDWNVHSLAPVEGFVILNCETRFREHVSQIRYILLKGKLYRVQLNESSELSHSLHWCCMSWRLFETKRRNCTESHSASSSSPKYVMTCICEVLCFFGLLKGHLSITKWVIFETTDIIMIIRSRLTWLHIIQ